MSKTKIRFCVRPECQNVPINILHVTEIGLMGGKTWYPGDTIYMCHEDLSAIKNLEFGNQPEAWMIS